MEDVVINGILEYASIGQRSAAKVNTKEMVDELVCVLEA